MITPLHVSFQPRTLREADAFSDAGHEVRVVARQMDASLSESDMRLMRTRRWRLLSLDLRRHGPAYSTWRAEAVRSAVFTRLYAAGVRWNWLAIRGYLRGFDRMVRLAASEQADWYIAHTQPVLPVAAIAAKRWGARLGFDCEDLLAEVDSNSANVVRMIERTYLPSVDYVSTASAGMADVLIRSYAKVAPHVLYNVFPLRLARDLAPPEQRPDSPVLRIHWFGQTIGQGRGLEDAIEALALLEQPAELYLRGRVSPVYRTALEDLAARGGVRNRLFFLPAVDHESLFVAMRDFDIGLVLERPQHGNNGVTAANKLFGYFLAGLAVAATDTPGHREVLSRAPAAGFCYPAGEPGSLAHHLRSWQQHRSALRSAQQASWTAARQGFSWDFEQHKLLDLVAQAPARAA